jgi:hypothetical protein
LRLFLLPVDLLQPRFLRVGFGDLPGHLILGKSIQTPSTPSGFSGTRLHCVLS